MSDLSLSDKYGIAAAIGLLVLALIDNAWVMLIVSLAGLVAGAFVVRARVTKRVAYVAAIAFAIALGFAVFQLLL